MSPLPDGEAATSGIDLHELGRNVLGLPTSAEEDSFQVFAIVSASLFLPVVLETSTDLSCDAVGAKSLE
jgi:hypothetical protein